MQIGVGVLLLAITIGSICGRMNDAFGAKLFRMPKEQVRANWGHIMWLTAARFFVTPHDFNIRLEPQGALPLTAGAGFKILSAVFSKPG